VLSVFKRTDKDIRDKVKADIALSTSTADAIDVAVQHGIVTLTGTADSSEMASRRAPAFPRKRLTQLRTGDSGVRADRADRQRHHRRHLAAAGQHLQRAGRRRAGTDHPRRALLPLLA